MPLAAFETIGGEPFWIDAVPDVPEIGVEQRVHVVSDDDRAPGSMARKTNE
jgi:hypothetical protein